MKRGINSFTRRKRLEIQGYCGYTDDELNSFVFGIRFAYILSTLLVALGLLFHAGTVLAVPLLLAVIGVFSPRHPFDYLYNHVVRFWLNKPIIPKRSPQSKFVFGLASIWLTAIIILFGTHFFVWGYILGAALLGIAMLVSTTDICIPSIFYNFIFRIKIPEDKK